MIAASPKDAQSRLDDLVARAEGGEEVVLEREGRPVVRFVAIVATLEPGAGPEPEFCGSLTKSKWDALDREIDQIFEESADRPFDQTAVP